MTRPAGPWNFDLLVVEDLRIANVAPRAKLVAVAPYSAGTASCRKRLAWNISGERSGLARYP